MSFDLSFWREDVSSTSERAAEIYRRHAAGESGVVTESQSVGEFFADVIAVFDDLTEENMDESPWMSSPYCTDECVLVAIAHRRSGEVAAVLRELANKHGLTMYDPQNRKVIPPQPS